MSRYSHADYSWYTEISENIDEKIKEHNKNHHTAMELASGFLNEMLTFRLNGSQDTMPPYELLQIVSGYNTKDNPLRVHMVTDSLGCLYVWFCPRDTPFYTAIDQQDRIDVRTPKISSVRNYHLFNTLHPSVNAHDYVSTTIEECCDSLCTFFASSLLMYVLWLNTHNYPKTKITLKWAGDRPFLLLNYSESSVEYMLYDHMHELFDTVEMICLRGKYASSILIEQNGHGIMAVHFMAPG